MASTLQNIVEPIVITFIFLVGLLLNRRRRSKVHGQRLPTSPHDSDAEIPLLKTYTARATKMHGIPIPDTRPFRRNFVSKLLARFPFAMEIIYWLLTYWPYQLLRAMSALRINATPEHRALVTSVAQTHASQILALEQRLGLAFELRLQRYIMHCPPIVMTLLSDVYLAHITVGIAFLAYGYTYLPRARYTALRRTLALDNALAFPILSLWRCAPPRLMPARLGFVDILHPPAGTPGAPSAWANNRFQLTLAAMPSLHFGTAVLLGTSIALWGRHAWLRTLAPLYPILMAVTVVATANHWVLDCIAGVCVVVTGLHLNRVMLILRPLEEWLFWVCRTERPRHRSEEVEDDKNLS